MPNAIPSAIEADVSALTIGGQVRVSDLTLPVGVTTDVDPESAIAIGQPPRVEAAEEPGEGEEGAAETAAEGGGQSPEAASEEG